MKLIEPVFQYRPNGGGLANVALTYIPTGAVIGYLTTDIGSKNWGLYYIRTDLLHVDILQEITSILKTVNSRTAPPSGYYRCVGCGSLFKIQEVPYEEQSACEHDSCDGQVFCCEYSGWLYK